MHLNGRFLRKKSQFGPSTIQTGVMIVTHWINEVKNDILEFWFGAPVSPTGLDPKKQRIWFSKDPKVDREIATRFGGHLERASREALPDALDSPRAYLAMIVLLDQFSRNIHRGDARAFATDAKALTLSLDGYTRGMDRWLTPTQRVFFYLPLEHAEDADMQSRSVHLFRTLAEEVDPSDRSIFSSFLDYAERHRDIILRFGRFPHRNAILGRSSSAEEIAFLETPGSGF